MLIIRKRGLYFPIAKRHPAITKDQKNIIRALGLKKRHGQLTEGYDAVRDFVFYNNNSPGGKDITVKGNLSLGSEIPSLTKIAWQRALHEKTFLSASIHDDQYTRGQGYAGPLVSGYILNEYMSQMLLDFFGPYWLKGGVISQSFINGGVQEGDRLVCHGRIIGITKEAAGTHLNLDIWMKKDQGVKVLVGKASGLVRKN